MQTIEQIQTAVLSAFPTATPQEQGKAIAAIIESLSQPERRTRTAAPKAPRTKAATIAPPARKAEPKSDSKQRMTESGRMMSAEPSTITEGQIKRIYGEYETQTDFVEDFKIWWTWKYGEAARPKTMRHFSMADASDFYAWVIA